MGRGKPSPAHAYTMIRFNPGRLNKIATFAVLPLIGFGLIIATRSQDDAANPPDLRQEGILVIANLASEDLTIYDLSESKSPATLNLPGPPHEIARLGNRLYITLDRADGLVEVDPFAPGILRVVHLPGRPHGIAIDHRGIHVTLDDANEVVTLNPVSLEVIDRQPTGDTPHIAAAHDDVLYITDTRDDRLRAIHPGGETTLRETGALPESLAIAGDRLIVGEAESGALAVFQLDGLEFEGIVKVGGWPARLEVHGDHLIVARSRAATLDILHLSDFSLVSRIDLGLFPDGICISPSGRYAGVATNDDGLLTVIDTEDWEALGTIAGGTGPGACAWLARN